MNPGPIVIPTVRVESLLYEFCFQSIFEIHPETGSYRRATHRHDAYRKFFLRPLLILKSIFLNVVPGLRNASESYRFYT